jgi:hypothetical protein
MDHTDDERLVKVVFRVEDGDSVYVETPWARHLGNNEYELDNLPWYAYGISLGDVFEATPDADDPRPHLRRVLRKSGNRTLRIIFAARAEDSPETAAVLDTLVKMGCSYEGANGKFIAVNIPQAVDLDEVGACLTKTGTQWEHADPTWESLHGEGDSDAG